MYYKKPASPDTSSKPKRLVHTPPSGALDFSKELRLYECSLRAKSARYERDFMFFLTASFLAFGFNHALNWYWFGTAVSKYMATFGIVGMLFSNKRHQSLGEQNNKKVESLSLLQDGMSIKLVLVSGESAIHQIEEIQCLGNQNLRKVVKEEKELGGFHVENLILTLKSKQHEDGAINYYLLDRGIIDLMSDDDENFKLLKCVVNGVNVKTRLFEETWDQYARERGLESLYDFFEDRPIDDDMSSEIKLIPELKEDLAGLLPDSRRKD